MTVLFSHNIFVIGSSLLYFLETFSSYIFPFHVFSAWVFLIQWFLCLPGTRTAENTPQDEHGTLYQIADCGPIVANPDYINTGYCQGTLLPKMNCSLFKNITRALIVPWGILFSLFFQNLYHAIRFLPELFWYDEFKHYTTILMKWFWNFIDPGILLLGQQQVISPWPQNPQGLMDFGYPIEVMQITKTLLFFFAHPLLPGYFAHIPGRLGVTFCSWRQ
jgi:hypothetical protein